MSELVKYEEQDQIAPLSFTRQNTMLHSLDLKNPEHEALYFEATNGEAIRLAEHIGETITVENALVQSVQLIREDGEIVNATRTVLFTPTGDIYACVSGGVYQSIQNMCGPWGTFPWKPAREVTIKQRSLDGGKKRMLYLVPHQVPKNKPKK